MTSPVQQIVTAQTLPSAATVLYTSPAATWTQIVKLTCTNNDTASHQVTLYLIPAGGSPSAVNPSTNAQSILPKATWNSPNEYALVLNPGDTLQGFADTAGKVNILVAGVLSD